MEQFKLKNTLFSKFILIAIFILYATISKSQGDFGCLSKHQLFKMQSSSLDDIRMFLNNENWSLNEAKSNQSYNYFDYPINYNVISWEKSSYSNGGNIILYNSIGKPNIVIYQSNSICFNELLKSFATTKGKTMVNEDKLVTIFKESSITIEFREYRNDYSNRQYSILVYNSTALFKEIQNLKEQAESLRKAEEEQKKKYDNSIAEGDVLFSLSKFKEAKLKYLIALEIENNILVQSKIDLCDKAFCEILILKGDSLFNIIQYDKALSVFKEAEGCSKSHLLQEKIKKIEERILFGKINAIQIKADLYFIDKKYDLAIDNYNLILTLDKSNVYASERIKKILEIKNIIAKRSTTIFSYKSTNNNDLIQFQNLLLDDVKLQMNKYKEGSLNLNYFISFDTLGNNLSAVKNISTSLNGYKTNLSNIISNDILKPSIEGGYFLASQENLILDVKWHTTKEVFKSNSKGISQNKYSINNLNPIESFINKQQFKYGKYIIEIKNKEINKKSYSNMYLVKYKIVGPEAAIYSMLIPGMGSLKVTYGKEGWGRVTCFLLSSGLAIGSKLYSNAQYKSYLGAISQADIDKYYNNANISNKIALISGGISASIYMYDILWVISKGANNIKYSKPLRKQLKQGPINIQNQSISWQ
jgi:hypothetical protein